MSTRNYIDGILREQWDDATRMHSTYDEQGKFIASVPYTPEENAAADAAAASALEEGNKRTVEEAITADLAKMQAIIADTNTNINSNPAARIKDIARAIRRLDRVALQDYTGTE